MENKYVGTQKSHREEDKNSEIEILQKYCKKNVHKERNEVANAVSLSSLFLLLFFASSLCCIGPAEEKTGECEFAI